MYYADACGRPPPEVQQTIICGACFTSNPYSFYLTGSAGGDWDLFAPCCNSSASAHQAMNNRTVYFSATSCGNFCLTNDTLLANAWDGCVADAVRTFASSNRTGNATSCGRCEYLNKDFLKNGLQSGAAPSPKGRTALLLVGLVAISFMAL
jgi:hypothetical protein